MAKSTHFDDEFLRRWPYLNVCDDCDGAEIVPMAPNLTRFRLARRICWRVITVNGSIPYALEKYQFSWMAATGLVMAIAWTDFLHKHVEGLFQDGTNDLPLMERQLGYVMAITVVCTVLPAVVTNLYYAYNSRCVPMHRRVFRRRFEKLVNELLDDDPFAPRHDLDYDSDGCPDAQFAYFRQIDTKDDAVAFVVSRQARNKRRKKAEDIASNRLPLLKPVSITLRPRDKRKLFDSSCWDPRGNVNNSINYKGCDMEDAPGTAAVYERLLVALVKDGHVKPEAMRATYIIVFNQQAEEDRKYAETRATRPDTSTWIPTGVAALEFE